MVAGDGFEGIGGEAEVHLMAGFILEIDGKTGEDGIDGGDLAEAPAPVEAEAAGGQLNQGINTSTLQS